MRSLWLVLAVAACGGNGGAPGDGPPGGTGADAPPGTAAAQQVCVQETNRYRAMVGHPALAESAMLEAFASTGAMYDFTNGPHAHFMATNGGGVALAENECPVQGGWTLSPGGDLSALVKQCIAAFYSEGPGTDYSTHGHYINMMGPYANLGCGIYQMGTGITIVQDYGA
jgi:hypothetical protein